jgi:hypothetical protein
MDTFTCAYIETMLWAETDDDGEPFDANYTAADIAPNALEEIKSDCANFKKEQAAHIGSKFEQAGHDFYLTRNRHGAGFWDGDWPPEVGRILTEAAHVYGTQGLYCGDDGRLYVHG